LARAAANAALSDHCGGELDEREQQVGGVAADDAIHGDLVQPLEFAHHRLRLRAVTSVDHQRLHRRRGERVVRWQHAAVERFLHPLDVVTVRSQP
jgi:hypothetical protein